MSAAGYARASLAIVRFFCGRLGRLRRLERLTDDVNEQLRRRPEKFSVSIDRAIVDDYNAGLEALREEVRREVPPHAVWPQSFDAAAAGFFASRALCAVAAALAPAPAAACFAASLLQFVLLPFSLHVSFLHLIVLAVPLFGPHVAAAAALTTVVPSWASVHVTLGSGFVAAFLLADQLMCSLLCVVTPKGRAVTKDGRTLLAHVIFGFFNCKTYSLILLLLLRGFRLNLTVWALDALLGVSDRIADWSSRHLYRWGIIFYHQHRLAHLPVVYNQAHKFHHRLHDTTAFDAHVYGAGAPEEWFSLWLEAGVALGCGLCPPALSLRVLMQSVSSKVGHTRTVGGGAGGVNHHADHHTLHRKNFGFGSTCFVDMLFGTNSDDEVYELGAYTVRRSASPPPGRVEFVFERTARAEDEARALEGRIAEYYEPTVATLASLVREAATLLAAGAPPEQPDAKGR